jgi:hypothetical protein
VTSDAVRIGLSLGVGRLRARPGVLLASVALCALAAGWALTPSGGAGRALAWQHDPPAGLVVESVHVSPTIVRTGETLVLEARIRNAGVASVHDLAIRPAVSAANAPSPRWGLLGEAPGGSVAELRPGEAVDYRAEIWVGEPIVAVVAVTAVAANAFVAPTGVTVRVVRARSEIAVDVLLMWLVFLLACALVLALADRCGMPSRLLTPRSWRWRYLLVAACFALAAVVTAARLRAIAPALLAFFCGWLLGGVALADGRKSLCGAVTAAVTYFVVGYTWLAVFNVAVMGAPAGTVVADLVRSPANAALAAAWPLQMAQHLGLLGLGID